MLGKHFKNLKARLLYGLTEQSKRCFQGNPCNVSNFAFKIHVILTEKKKKVIELLRSAFEQDRDEDIV